MLYSTRNCCRPSQISRVFLLDGRHCRSCVKEETATAACRAMAGVETGNADGRDAAREREDTYGVSYYHLSQLPILALQIRCQRCAGGQARYLIAFARRIRACNLEYYDMNSSY